MKSKWKELRRTTRLAILWTLIALVAATGGTWAWFTFSYNTQVGEIAGQVFEGDTIFQDIYEYIFLPDDFKLEISNQKDGPYSTTCELIIQGGNQELDPVSTSKLTSFYYATAQNRNGISVLFEDITPQVDSMILHGTVYLKVTQQDGSVYIDPEVITSSLSDQALHALRLGFKITNGEATYTYVFPLDTFAKGTTVESKTTVTQENAVIDSINADGTPNFVADPSVSISNYYLDKTPLLDMKNGDIATVEYFLYLEGCDEHCINAIQGSEVQFTLGFTGK